MPEYRFPVDECDVQNKALLAEYRTKRNGWLEQLTGDEEHSIWHQIHSMMWNDAVFRLINETRRLAADNNLQGAVRNGMLGEFIDTGYVTTQVLSIRRLTDPAPRNRDPERQVVSLKRLIDDIQENWHLFTRESYVCHDGFPYDFEPAKERHREKLIAEHDGSAKARFVKFDPPDDYASSERMHNLFDRLSGTTAGNRSRDDTMQLEISDRLQELLNKPKIQEVRARGNKFVAHAADQFSRRAIPEENRWFSLEDYDECHRAICACTTFVAGEVLYEGANSYVPHPQFGILESLDGPWTITADHDDLTNFFFERVRETESWSRDAQDILDQIG